MEPLIRTIGGIGVSRALFQEIISRTDPTSLALLGSEISRNNVPLSFELLGLELNLSSVRLFMKEVLQEIGWFKMETISTEDYCEFKLFHNYNIHWSVFLESCLSSIFEFIHEVPEIAISERVVKLRLSRKSFHEANPLLENFAFN